MMFVERFFWLITKALRCPAWHRGSYCTTRGRRAGCPCPTLLRPPQRRRGRRSADRQRERADRRASTPAPRSTSELERSGTRHSSRARTSDGQGSEGQHSACRTSGKASAPALLALVIRWISRTSVALRAHESSSGVRVAQTCGRTTRRSGRRSPEAGTESHDAHAPASRSPRPRA